MKEGRNTVCFFCSLGCGLTIACGEKHVHYQSAAANELDYQTDNLINKGSLCGKCNYIFELLSHPKRIAGPQIKIDEKLRNERWNTALAYSAERIFKAVSTYGPGCIGIMLSPHLTVEEAEQTVALAKLIGTPHIDCCSLEDKPILAKIQNSTSFEERLPDIRNMEKMQTVFVIGDLFGLSPVLSRHILRAKYEKRAHKLIVAESYPSHTGWFADTYLQPNPGTEAILLTGILKLLVKQAGGFWKSSPEGMGSRIEPVLDSIELDTICAVTSVSLDNMQYAANLLRQGNPSLVALASGFGVYDRADLVTSLCQAVASASDSYFLPVFTGANSRGVFETLRLSRSSAGMTASQLIEAMENGKIKALLNFGVDIVRTFPGKRAQKALKQLEFLLSTSLFPNDTTAVSHVVFPAAAWAESSGTTVNMFGMRLPFEPVMPPPGYVKTTKEILNTLLEVLKNKGFQEKPMSSGAHTPNKKDIASDIAEVKDFLTHYTPVTDGQKVLISHFEFVHFGDGSITRYLHWSRSNSPEPIAVVADEGDGISSVKDRSASDGKAKMIRIRSGEQEIIVPVSVRRRAKKGVVSAPVHFPQIRSLFAWEMLPEYGYLNIKPAKVTIEYL